MEPAILDRGGGRLGIVPIAQHVPWAPQDDLAGLAGRTTPPVGVDDGDFRKDAAAAAFVGVGHGERLGHDGGVAPTLGLAIDLAQDDPLGQPLFLQGGRDPRSAGGGELQARQIRLRKPRAGGDPFEEQRNGPEGVDLLRRQDTQEHFRIEGRLQVNRAARRGVVDQLHKAGRGAQRRRADDPCALRAGRVFEREPIDVVEHGAMREHHALGLGRGATGRDDHHRRLWIEFQVKLGERAPSQGRDLGHVQQRHAQAGEPFAAILVADHDHGRGVAQDFVHFVGGVADVQGHDDAGRPDHAHDQGAIFQRIAGRNPHAVASPDAKRDQLGGDPIRPVPIVAIGQGLAGQHQGWRIGGVLRPPLDRTAERPHPIFSPASAVVRFFAMVSSARIVAESWPRQGAKLDSAILPAP